MWTEFLAFAINIICRRKFRFWFEKRLVGFYSIIFADYSFAPRIKLQCQQIALANVIANCIWISPWAIHLLCMYAVSTFQRWNTIKSKFTAHCTEVESCAVHRKVLRILISCRWRCRGCFRRWVWIVSTLAGHRHDEVNIGLAQSDEISRKMLFQCLSRYVWFFNCTFVCSPECVSVD